MPPYLRLVLASACWKASKIIFCFSGGMPIPEFGDLEGDDLGNLIENRMRRRPTFARRRYLQPNPALVGKLERIGKQVLQHLLQSLRVGREGAGQALLDLNIEGQVPRLSLVTERPSHRFHEAREGNFLGIDRHRAGFDLREVENVADES